MTISYLIVLNIKVAYIGYAQPKFDVKAEYQYVGDYFSGLSNTDSQQIEDYGLLNLSGSYRFMPSISANVRITNVLDESYVTTPNYNTDGTNYMLSLTYQGF